MSPFHRLLTTLAALGDRFLATHLDRRLCEWANVTDEGEDA